MRHDWTEHEHVTRLHKVVQNSEASDCAIQAFMYRSAPLSPQKGDDNDVLCADGDEGRLYGFGISVPPDVSEKNCVLL